MTIDERNALVIDNQRLAFHLAWPYVRFLGAEDARQEALLALVEASRGFDPAKAPVENFARYAGLAIKHRLQRAVKRLPSWTLESTLGDRAREFGPIAKTGRKLSADQAVNFALSRLGPSDRELVADRHGLFGRPRLKWADMESKHGRSAWALAKDVKRARRVMADSLALAWDGDEPECAVIGA